MSTIAEKIAAQQNVFENHYSRHLIGSVELELLLNNDKILEKLITRIKEQQKQSKQYLQNEDWACGDMGDMQMEGALARFCQELVEIIK